MSQPNVWLIRVGVSPMFMRAISVSLLSVALSASVATAGCAWVLWQQESNGRWDLEKGSIRLAFDTRRECEQQRDARIQFMAKVAERDPPGRLTPSVVMMCLPDTIDPRAPKGK
jgi:hypothetical protein